MAGAEEACEEDDGEEDDKEPGEEYKGHLTYTQAVAETGSVTGTRAPAERSSGARGGGGYPGSFCSFGIGIGGFLGVEHRPWRFGVEG